MIFKHKENSTFVYSSMKSFPTSSKSGSMGSSNRTPLKKVLY